MDQLNKQFEGLCGWDVLFVGVVNSPCQFIARVLHGVTRKSRDKYAHLRNNVT